MAAEKGVVAADPSKPTSGQESSSEYRTMDPIVGIAFSCCTCNISMLQ